jgi:hypothetical protein
VLGNLVVLVVVVRVKLHRLGVLVRQGKVMLVA